MPGTTLLNRRQLICTLAKGAAGLSLLGIAGAGAGELPHLSPDDPTAKSLNYVDDASQLNPAKTPGFEAGHKCSGCALFEGANSGDWAGCTTFPGKAVNKNGWCIAFAPI